MCERRGLFHIREQGRIELVVNMVLRRQVVISCPKSVRFSADIPQEQFEVEACIAKVRIHRALEVSA